MSPFKAPFVRGFSLFAHDAPPLPAVLQRPVAISFQKLPHKLRVTRRAGTDIGATRLSGMGHITADDAKWLVSIAILGVLMWSVAFLVLAVQPANPRGVRQRRADRQAAWRGKGYRKQRALSPLAFVAMVFPPLIVIVWCALPRHVRHQALEGVNFGAATDNAIGIGRQVRALAASVTRRVKLIAIACRTHR
jgi:hypothetical protein